MKTLAAIAIFLTLACGTAMSQTTEFNYQGSLQNAGIPANGNYDMQFTVYDAPTGGNPQGSTMTKLNVAVTNGVFGVVLDIGSLAFRLNLGRFLEIAVRPAGGGSYTNLTPRHQFTATPYAIAAVNARDLGGVSAASYVLTTDPRLSDPRDPQPNSPNYIQNGTGVQSSSSFNISGNGTVGGSLFIGMNPGDDNLDVTGRIAIRQGASSPNSAGIAFEQNNPDAVNAFVGMQDNNNVGFFGNVGGWGLVMNTQTGFTSIKGVGGNLGIGTTTPGFRLDVVGRSRFRQNAGDTGTTNTAGFWFFQNTPNQDRAFVGMETDSRVGFFGANGGGWGLVMDTGNGRTIINQLGVGGAMPLCRNASNEISTCSSSARYKENINAFSSGLDLIRRLRPVTFNWKDGGMADMGLVAEEVAKVEPLLTSTNDNGEVEGVKYDRVSVVLINAVKDQQAQIEAQRLVIDQLTKKVAELDDLKAYICGQKPDAQICKPKH